MITTVVSRTSYRGAQTYGRQKASKDGAGVVVETTAAADLGASRPAGHVVGAMLSEAGGGG